MEARGALLRCGRCVHGTPTHSLPQSRNAGEPSPAVDMVTRFAHTVGPRAEAQVNQHRRLLHAISRTLKRLGVPDIVETEELITADRNWKVNIVNGA